MKSQAFLDYPLPIAIVGLGVTGQSVLQLLLSAGLSPDRVGTFDEKDPKAQFKDPLTLLQKFAPRTLVVSPGVPLAQSWIQAFRHTGGRIASELEIAQCFLQQEKIIGITGSIGKSTVTSLIGAAAQAIDPQAFVGGNLGVPLAVYAKEVLLGKRSRGAWVILELSSYQLENFLNLKSEIAVFTFLTSNHLERYAHLHEYYQTKWHLAQTAKAAVVLNKSGGDLFDFVADRPRSQLPFYWEDRNTLPAELKAAKLLGAYNQDNLAVAARVANIAGWGSPALAALRDFAGLAHRFENLGERKNILFINDSKATTMESVRSAVETVDSFAQNRRRWVLLGGHDKNLPWEQLQILKNRPHWNCLFFGEYGAKAQERIGATGPQFSSLREALVALPNLVSSGDLVLLSPGGTSHDEFQNFEQRGAFFKSEVLRLF